MRPLTSGNRAATIHRRSIPLRLEGSPVPAIGEIRVYRSTRLDCASNAFLWLALVDGEIRVSSVATLTICWRINVPALF